MTPKTVRELSSALPKPVHTILAIFPPQFQTFSHANATDPSRKTPRFCSSVSYPDLKSHWPEKDSFLFEDTFNVGPSRLTARDLSYRLQYTLDLVREMSEKTQSFLNSHNKAVKETQTSSSSEYCNTGNRRSDHVTEGCGSGRNESSQNKSASSFAGTGYSLRSPKTQYGLIRNGPIDTKPYSRLVSSLDTSSLGHSALSPNGAVGFELDYETIQKQRRELQLLITELKDRDRELNEMVASHRRQLEAWEMDRQRLLSLEARCTKYEGEMSRKNEQIKQLANQIKVCESQDEAKQCELESLKMQLQNSTDECKNMSNTLRESEEKNGQLSRNLREATANVEELEVREQELVEVLNSKTAEMETLNGELLLLQETTQSQATQLKDLEISESNLKKENKEWRERAMECSTELSNLKPELEELAGKSSENEDKMLELQSQVDLLHKELSLTNERERRKDQLIDLQRSKQERTEAELSSLRQISERQQKEIAVLERSLHSAQDLLGEIELSGSNSNSANDARSMREYSHIYGDSTENDDSYVLPHSSPASGSLMTSYPTAPPHSHTHTHTPTHHHSSSRSCAGGVATATLTSHKKNVTFNQKKNDVHMLNSNSSSFSP